MTPFAAVIIGLVQGFSEFFPVSATGHLILVRAALGLTPQNTLAFDALLQLAAVAAIVVYFFGDIWLLTQTGLRKLGRLPVNERDETFLYALLVGTIPVLILWVALHSFMDTILHDPLFVAGILVAGAIFFMYVEWVYFNQPRNNEMTLWKGLKIGLFQCLALFPGFSRVGATIGGGMLFGLSRSESTRIAFLLGVPVLTVSAAKLLLQLIITHGTVDWVAAIIATSVAFFSGLLAIRVMVLFIRNHSLWAFIWYRIILAAFVLYIYFYG